MLLVGDTKKGKFDIFIQRLFFSEPDKLASNGVLGVILQSLKNIPRKISRLVTEELRTLNELSDAGLMSSHYWEDNSAISSALFIHSILAISLGMASAVIVLPSSGADVMIVSIVISATSVLLSLIGHWRLFHAPIAKRVLGYNKMKDLSMPSERTEFKLQRLIVVLAAPVMHIAIAVLCLIVFGISSLFGWDILRVTSFINMNIHFIDGTLSIVATDGPAVKDIMYEMKVERFRDILKMREFREVCVSL